VAVKPTRPLSCTCPRDKGKKSTPEFKNLRPKFRNGLDLATDCRFAAGMSKSFFKKAAVFSDSSDTVPVKVFTDEAEKFC
jgi:hypothetical protein